MPTIAIVHLEKNILIALRIALENEGFAVRTYADTAKADELIENPPDLYILPRRGRPVTGIALFKRIREHNQVPVVFLTVHPEIVQAELATMGLAAQAYIEMPFLQRAVIEQIRALLA